MMKFLPLGALALLLAACGDSPTADTTPSAPDAAVEVADVEVASAGQAEEINPDIDVDVPENYSPAFERDTVIGLNEIVRRSLTVIEEYDAMKRSISRATEAAPAPSVDEQRALLEDMDARAAQALEDITADAARLEASDEVYNAAILAGMVDFVTDVDREVSAALSELGATE